MFTEGGGYGQGMFFQTLSWGPHKQEYGQGDPYREPSTWLLSQVKGVGVL